MLTFLLWVLAAVLACFALLSVLNTARFIAYVRRDLAHERPPFAPRLSVIMPCKGVDPGFGENVRSLLAQDYPDFELLFVTATRQDPARPCLEELLGAHSDARARLLVAGIQPGRSQKLNNQLFACGHVRPDAEALVFVDSDVRAQPTFLRDLVAPLGEEGVGVATGFRWYIPAGGRPASYLRATWNGGGLPMLAHPRFAYAWGGSMAILRETFERAGVADRWAGALTDDFPLTDAVRKLGLQVKFVPRCLLGSHEDASLAQLIEWTNRQTVICRVYNPTLWWGILTFHGVHAVGVIAALSALGARALWPAVPLSIWPTVAMLGLMPVEAIAGLFLWGTVRRLLPGVGGWGRALRHVALAPAAVLLIFYNSVHSLLTHDICWRGVAYRLHSPVRTEVLGDGAPAEPRKA